MCAGMDGMRLCMYEYMYILMYTGVVEYSQPQLEI